MHIIAWLAQAGLLVLLSLFDSILEVTNYHDILFIFLDMQQQEIQSEHLSVLKDIHSPIEKRDLLVNVISMETTYF